jgi:apolipoprotein N-acyltransferase
VIISRFPAWRIALSVVAGVALALAFPVVHLSFLGWIAPALLMLALMGAGLGQATLCGFLFGAAFYTVSVPWIYTVMRQYGPLPVAQALAVMAAMEAASSLYFVLFAVPFAWMARRNARLALIAAPFLWVAGELIHTRTPQIAFPWELLGYTAASNLALAQLATLAGVYGLSFLVTAYSAVIVWMVRSEAAERRRAFAVWAAFTGMVAVVALFGGHFIPTEAPTQTAHLIQTNLPQEASYPADWDRAHAADMAEIERLSEEAGQRQPGLVVWPEVPAPFSLQDAPFAQLAANIARASRSDFLLGEVDWKPDVGNRLAAYNSAAMLDPTGREVFLYDKIKLVPYSEFVPGRSLFWFAGSVTALAGDFHEGTHYSVGDLPGGRFGVFICYESIFPDEIRRFVANGASVLINISDDGWFGRSAAPVQHLAMLRLRAVENRRWLLRDTNNGYTVSVDPYGRIVAGLPADTRGELDAPYAFRNDETLYTRWGDWIAWLSLMVSAGLIALAALGRDEGPAQAPESKARAKRKTRRVGRR